MRIPKSFQLFGTTIKVELKDGLIELDDAKGWAKYREGKILIQNPKTSKTPRFKAEKGTETFVHEVVHWILHMIGEDKKNDDERFVKLFGQALHQVLKTMKYE
jgi:hypothetical protein